MASKIDDSDEKKSKSPDKNLSSDKKQPVHDDLGSADLVSADLANTEGGADVAGPLIGWNLDQGLESAAPPDVGPGGAKQGLSELIDFPERYTFKVVGISSEQFLASVLDAINAALGRAIDDVKTASRVSAKGKYASISVELEMQNAAEVYACYAELKDLSGVRYVL
ncbi:MAG: DUF493 domain-containing protein [Deltaproteobacteria bacterium]|nr:DUF493 domain-containing protein [Deltaproteobacteria bacterium]